MTLPEKIKEVSIYSEIEIGGYPPNGFLQFTEASLGNGDNFGFYWEFGKEDKEPVICEMIHDEGIIVPRFSNLNKFLDWYKLNDYDWGEEEIEDEKFVFSLLHKGNDYLKTMILKKQLNFIKKVPKVLESLVKTGLNWLLNIKELEMN